MMPERMHVVSVPHTGTKFLLRILTKWRLDPRHVHISTSFPQGEQRARQWQKEGRRIVIPYRAPALCAESCAKRGERDQTDAFPLIHELAALPGVHLFRVDCAPEERESEWAMLADFCGVTDPGPVDWTPENAFNG